MPSIPDYIPCFALDLETSLAYGSPLKGQVNANNISPWMAPAVPLALVQYAPADIVRDRAHRVVVHSFLRIFLISFDLSRRE